MTWFESVCNRAPQLLHCASEKSPTYKFFPHFSLLRINKYMAMYPYKKWYILLLGNYGFDMSTHHLNHMSQNAYSGGAWPVCTYHIWGLATMFTNLGQDIWNDHLYTLGGTVLAGESDWIMFYSIVIDKKRGMLGWETWKLWDMIKGCQ